MYADLFIFIHFLNTVNLLSTLKLIYFRQIKMQIFKNFMSEVHKPKFHVTSKYIF